MMMLEPRGRLTRAQDAAVDALPARCHAALRLVAAMEARKPGTCALPDSRTMCQLTASPCHTPHHLTLHDGVNQTGAHVDVVGGGAHVLKLLACEDVDGGEVTLGVAVLARLGRRHVHHLQGKPAVIYPYSLVECFGRQQAWQLAEAEHFAEELAKARCCHCCARALCLPCVPERLHDAQKSVHVC
jgi:hypothetical protein